VETAGRQRHHNHLMRRFLLPCAVVLVAISCGIGVEAAQQARAAAQPASTASQAPVSDIFYSGFAGKTPSCSLRLTYGTKWQDPPEQFHVDLVVTDVDQNCKAVVFGVPDVELIGPPNDGNTAYPGTIYWVSEAGSAGSRVPLVPGGKAHFTLTWLSWNTGGSVNGRPWVPGYVRVVINSAGGPSEPAALPWPYGSVLRQDAATHPGTYAGPIVPTGTTRLWSS
jgi:hypothetical protein